MCMSVYYVRPRVHEDQKEVLDPLELKLLMLCDLPQGCWELNLDPLEEQPVHFPHCVISQAPNSLNKTLYC